MARLRAVVTIHAVGDVGGAQDQVDPHAAVPRHLPGGVAPPGVDVRARVMLAQDVAQPGVDQRREGGAFLGCRVAPVPPPLRVVDVDVGAPMMAATTR